MLMKSHIKFKLIKLEKSVVFQILEMDEHFRSSSTSNIFTSSNGIKIVSGTIPSLSLNTIYLRGKIKSSDFKPAVIVFVTNEQRDEFVSKIIYAIKEWSNKWPGFENDCETDENDVYCF